MGHDEHKKHSPKSISFSILTVSDSRTKETDVSGKIISEMLSEKKHSVINYVITEDDPRKIKTFILKEIKNRKVDAVIVDGGTGISPRDNTFEAVNSILEKRLDGFGELFRYLSYKEIGSSAIMSRAIAGVAKRKIIISIPGSENAVKLAMSKIILPEIGHMVWEVNK